LSAFVGSFFDGDFNLSIGCNVRIKMGLHPKKRIKRRNLQFFGCIYRKMRKLHPKSAVFGCNQVNNQGIHPIFKLK